MSFARLSALFACLVAGTVATIPLTRVDATSAADASSTFVVAHRGASAYAPEHTEAAYLLAIAQGAEYVEQDLGVTKDGVFVCTHDAMLERTTDARVKFPDRYREVTSGGRTQRHWFVEDFTLAEIKQLDAGSWFDPKFAGAKMLTFQEAIDIVKGKAGFFPELKAPARFRAAGFDPEQMVADALRKNGLVGAMFKGRPAVQMQVFEEDSVRRLAKVLPEVPRSFLVGSPAGAERWLTPAGLAEVKTFATGVAPSYKLIEARPQIVADAHAAGLTVVPYTFALKPKTNPYPDAPAEYRKVIEDALRGLPETPGALTAQMRRFVELKVDGMFTDNPDLFPR